ncbi:hypothetical protein MP228_003783 [Amoeboaphelidium protococcarum]|nr:hypothetical protein MP228_003783 [Amoeboaphelidium protococcarum]
MLQPRPQIKTYGKKKNRTIQQKMGLSGSVFGSLGFPGPSVFGTSAAPVLTAQINSDTADKENDVYNMEDHRNIQQEPEKRTVMVKKANLKDLSLADVSVQSNDSDFQPPVAVKKISTRKKALNNNRKKKQDVAVPKTVKESSESKIESDYRAENKDTIQNSDKEGQGGQQDKVDIQHPEVINAPLEEQQEIAEEHTDVEHCDIDDRQQSFLFVSCSPRQNADLNSPLMYHSTPIGSIDVGKHKLPRLTMQFQNLTPFKLSRNSVGSDLSVHDIANSVMVNGCSTDLTQDSEIQSCKDNLSVQNDNNSPSERRAQSPAVNVMSPDPENVSQLPINSHGGEQFTQSQKDNVGECERKESVLLLVQSIIDDIVIDAVDQSSGAQQQQCPIPIEQQSSFEQPLEVRRSNSDDSQNAPQDLVGIDIQGIEYNADAQNGPMQRVEMGIPAGNCSENQEHSIVIESAQDVHCPSKDDVSQSIDKTLADVKIDYALIDSATSVHSNMACDDKISSIIASEAVQLVQVEQSGQQQQSASDSEQDDDIDDQIVQTVEGVSRLSLGDQSLDVSWISFNQDQETYILKDIFRICNQQQSLSFTKLFKQFDIKNLCKLGEATFSEVYDLLLSSLHSGQYQEKQIEQKAIFTHSAAMKVIPFGDNRKVLVNGDPQTSVDELAQEFILTKLLGDCKLLGGLNFVQCLGLYVTSGKYPQKLLSCWDAWALTHQSENDRPDEFKSDQKYGVLLLQNGGCDLEHYKLSLVEQAVSLIVQCSLTIAQAEKTVQFEHRDLHWGNVLLKASDDQEYEYCIAGQKYNVPSGGVRCTIIDYTFSRVTISQQQVICRPYDEEAYFQGQGDYQFEVYRMMRDLLDPQHTGDKQCWKEFNPKTNIYWLHYLILKCLDDKGLRRKKSRMNSSQRLQLEELERLSTEILNYDSAHHLISSDSLFTSLLLMS